MDSLSSISLSMVLPPTSNPLHLRRHQIFLSSSGAVRDSISGLSFSFFRLPCSPDPCARRSRRVCCKVSDGAKAEDDDGREEVERVLTGPFLGVLTSLTSKSLRVLTICEDTYTKLSTPVAMMAIDSDPLANVDKEKTDVLMYCTGGIRCDVYSTILRERGFKNLFTLKGGVSHFLEKEGPVEWVGNLFVFDSRLSLPPSTYKPEAITEANSIKQVSENPFATCYICGTQVRELRHRNCANIDCNLLFLCCADCMKDLGGCCCSNCTTAPRLRPCLPGHQRYKKWHIYRDMELQTQLIV